MIGTYEIKLPILKQISQKFWEFVGQGGLFARATFLWTIVFSVNVLVYVALTKVVIPSGLAQDILSPYYLPYFAVVMEFMVLSSAMVYVALLLLKIFQNDISDVMLYGALTIACLDYIVICHFFGSLFVLLAPLFLIITIINVSAFLSPKMGRFTLACSVVMYGGSIVLVQLGYFSYIPIVRNHVSFNELLTNPTLSLVFSIGMIWSLLLFGYFVTSIINQKNLNTEQTVLLNQELKISNQKLKELDTMKNRFLAMVSHDLRTPMTSIKGYTKLLLKNIDKIDREEQKSFLKIVDRESDRLIRLIADLLDLQRLEAGMMIFRIENFDLIKLLNESVDTFQGAAYDKDLGLLKDMPAHEVFLNADRDRISQVVANLLSNAVKFTPEKGQVKVCAKLVNENGSSAIRVSVSDTGPGIPMEYFESVFDRFKRVYENVEVKGQGSGIGLAIVKEIIQLHGGKVGLESEIGKGSVFYFALNIEAPEIKKDS